MAKKKMTPGQPPAPSTSSAPAPRRRTPATRKSPPASAASAATPAETASVAGTEPLSIASDSGTATSDRLGTSALTQHQNLTHDQIAEAAYFRHLNRGGDGGDEFNDWVEAERELRSRNSR
jgi:hypothetical protein